MGCFGDHSVSTEVSKLADADTPTTPQKERIPNDVLFLLLFLAMLGGMGFISYYSTGAGDPYRYVNGSDSWGNVCGRNNTVIAGVPESGKDHSERTHEFHMGLSNIQTALNPFNYLKSKNKPAIICIKECPQEMIDCKDLLSENGYNLNDSVIDKHVCTMPYDLILSHTSLFNRCIPSKLVHVVRKFSSAVARNDANETETDANDVSEEDQSDLTPLLESYAVTVSKHIITSMLKYWRDIVYLSIGAFVLCFLVIILLQCFTRALVVFCIVFGGLGSILFTLYLWYSYAIVSGFVTEEKLSNAFDAVVPAGEAVLGFIEKKLKQRASLVTNLLNVTTPSTDLLSNYSITAVEINDLFDTIAFDSIKQSEYLFPWAIVSTIITLIILLILVAVRKSLCLVVNIFHEASLAIVSMPLTLFEPIKSLFAVTYICVYFFIIGAYIITIQSPVVDERGFVRFIERTGDSIVTLFCFHLFGCLWLLEFISGCQQIILAGTISKWFFSRDVDRKNKKSLHTTSFVCELKVSPTARATADLAFYHLGTVALGSLIIAIVQFARIFLEYIQRKLHGQDSALTQNLMRALKCCLVCFERVLKFINRNAYICAAMYGYNFIKSGKRAVTLIVNNAQHAMALNCISSFCSFLGKIGVVVVSAFSTVAYFKFYRLGMDAVLSEYLVPLISVSIAAYLIAHCFFTVYDTALDTIFLCFCDDQERNNGEDRPYYSSVNLQQYMSGRGSSNKIAPLTQKEKVATPDESARGPSPYSLSVPDLKKIRSLQAIPRPRASRYRRNRTITTFSWNENETRKHLAPISPVNNDLKARGEGVFLNKSLPFEREYFDRSTRVHGRTPTPFRIRNNPKIPLTGAAAKIPEMLLPGQILEEIAEIPRSPPTPLSEKCLLSNFVKYVELIEQTPTPVSTVSSSLEENSLPQTPGSLGGRKSALKVYSCPSTPTFERLISETISLHSLV